MDVFVGSLPFKMKENQLKSLFEQYGEVSSVKIIINKITRQNKGFGFVEMPDENQAMKAIEELNGFEIEGRSLEVSKSVKKEKVFQSENTVKKEFRPFRKDSGKKTHSKEENKGGYFKGIRGKKKY